MESNILRNSGNQRLDEVRRFHQNCPYEEKNGLMTAYVAQQEYVCSDRVLFGMKYFPLRFVCITSMTRPRGFEED
jgi:hypothetical protein